MTPVPPLMFPLRGSRIRERAASEKRSRLPENLLAADTQAFLNISYRSDAAAGRLDRMRWSFLTEQGEMAKHTQRLGHTLFIVLSLFSSHCEGSELNGHKWN